MGRGRVGAEVPGPPSRSPWPPPDHITHVPFSRAQVFKARKAGSLATVAVKLITKRGKNDKDLLGLRQEIDILRHLRHNHIIQMLDAFETSTDFCVVTEFAQGTVLGGWAQVEAGPQRAAGWPEALPSS